jgi:predicted nuclease with TOPRIM domain
MNLKELQTGLKNEALTEETLNALQPLYLLDEELTKQQFYKLVSAIGIKAAISLAQKVNEQSNKAAECWRRIEELENQIAECKEQVETAQTVKAAVSADYHKLSARYNELLQKHSEFVAFAEKCPEVRDLYLNQKKNDARKLYEFMVSSPF